MEDKKMLNNEELEKVVGGTNPNERNLYEKAIENAIQKIEYEYNHPSKWSSIDGSRLIKVYKKMLIIFNSLLPVPTKASEAISLAIQSLDSIPETFGRPQEIIDDFKREVQC